MREDEFKTCGAALDKAGEHKGRPYMTCYARQRSGLPPLNSII